MKPLVILTGPTAVGKTNLSIGLAKRIMVRSFLQIPCRSIERWISELPRSCRRKWMEFHII